MRSLSAARPRGNMAVLTVFAVTLFAAAVEAFTLAGAPCLLAARSQRRALSGRLGTLGHGIRMSSNSNVGWTRPPPHGKMDVVIGAKVDTTQNVLPDRDEGCNLQAYMRSSSSSLRAPASRGANQIALCAACPLTSTSSSHYQTRRVSSARMKTTSRCGCAPGHGTQKLVILRAPAAHSRQTGRMLACREHRTDGKLQT